MSKTIIGVTGAIGSGKSTVSAILASHGGFIIDADKISRSALDVGNEPYNKVVHDFGESILNPDKTIDRAKLRKIIIEYPKMKEKLESIIHPYVIERTFSLINKPIVCKFFVIDAPLLFEANMDKLCDYVFFVDVDPQLRYIRLRNRNTMALNDASSLEKSILDNEEKKQKSDFIIENSSTLEYLHEQIFAILSKLMLLK
jgi:dephospho-CoA kinase